MNDAQERIEIANTILRQIGVATRMACGIRQPLATDSGVLCVVGRTVKTKLEITLNGRDLYDLRSIRIRRDWSVEELGAMSDVGAEELSEAVYSLLNR